MLITQHTEITIRNVAADAIWEFAYNPVNWTASNPQEHRGLAFDNKHNRPETGATFVQKEYVAGLYADLRGQVLYAERPRVCVWTGVATYKLYGIPARIPEGGLVKLVDTEGGITMSHDVYMDFPDSFFGRVALWYFRTVRKGERAVFSHTQRELEYFKVTLEGASGSAPTC